MKEYRESRGFVEFGPKNTAPVPLSAINEIEQIRKTYDPGAITELATSIVHEEDGNTWFDMYNPLLAACLTPEEAEQYLKEHAAFHEGSQSIDSLTPDHDGNYIILISGHRRKRAIEQLLSQHDIAPECTLVNVNLRRGITFEEALVAQVRENTHEKVSPIETAKYIEQLYIYLRDKEGAQPTYRRLSMMTGISEGIISTALRFQRLPESIRLLATTHGDILPYSTLVRLEPLMRKRGELYDKLLSLGQTMDGEDRKTYVENHLHIAANKIVKLRLGAEKRIHFIQQQISDIELQIINAQPCFDLIAPTSSGEQRHVSNTRLGGAAISALHHAYGGNPGNMPPEQLAELKELVAKAEALATPIASACQQESLLLSA
ncbi:hypothetical protein FBF28_02735 [Candidatus Saccharibacteria bacterium oral taxon 488]|nr:hypothetical protein FBF28_02735 [Candidatus Saccharibacteria bacterium oral taxon 488]